MTEIAMEHAGELQGTYACPICGVDTPHDHDTQTKFDWANRPWLVRAARAANERKAFEALITMDAVYDTMQINNHSYIGRIYWARGEHWPPTFFVFDKLNEVYECPATAAFHRVWKEAVRHTIEAMRKQAPLSRAASCPPSETPQQKTDEG